MKPKKTILKEKVDTPSEKNIKIYFITVCEI